ncbi:MAG: PHD finger domain-containing protein [Sedimenticola sp.]
MDKLQEKTYMRHSSLMASSTPVTKRLRNLEASANLCPKCEKEIQILDPSFDCAMCGARYCLKCTKIPLLMYDQLDQSDVQGFTWFCRGCKVALPTLKSMDKTLKEIDKKNEHRLDRLEDKLDKLDIVITEKVTEQVKVLKTEVVEEISEDFDKMIDKKIKEYEDQQYRATNVIVYNLPEFKSMNPETRRAADIENFLKLANEINVPEVTIKTAIRLGQRAEGRDRPLKIVIDNKQHRKMLLVNSKNIATKATEFKKAVIARDLTPKQREESRKLRAELQLRRNAGEIVTIRQGKVVQLQNLPGSMKQQTHNKEGTEQKREQRLPSIQAQSKTDLTSRPSAAAQHIDKTSASEEMNSPNMDISSILLNDDTVIGGIPIAGSVTIIPVATGGNVSHS